MHSVGRGTGTPKDRDEVNRQSDKDIEENLYFLLQLLMIVIPKTPFLNLFLDFPCYFRRRSITCSYRFPSVLLHQGAVIHPACHPASDVLRREGQALCRYHYTHDRASIFHTVRHNSPDLVGNYLVLGTPLHSSSDKF